MMTPYKDKTRQLTAMRKINTRAYQKRNRYLIFAKLMEDFLMNLEQQQAREDTAYYRLFGFRGMMWFLPVGKSISENTLLRQTYEILRSLNGVVVCTFEEFLADLRAYPKLYAIRCEEPDGGKK